MKKITCIDHLVTGETFVLEPTNTDEILQTTPQPKQLDRYYNHPNYISHTIKEKSLFFALYALLRQQNHKYKTKRIHKHLSTKGRLLDFGAGTGSFVRFAQKQGWNTVAYEPNSKAHGPKATYVKEWAKASHYNAITAWHVIEHLPKPKAFLQQAHLSLVNDGKLFVALPNFKSWDAKTYGAEWAGYDVPRHLWHFSPKGFINMSKDCGFIVEKTYPLTMDAYYVSLLSEKNKQSRFPLLKSIYAGWRSNQAAKHTQNHSSVMFVLKKAK